jgi:hypothetical protein
MKKMLVLLVVLGFAGIACAELNEGVSSIGINMGGGAWWTGDFNLDADDQAGVPVQDHWNNADTSGWGGPLTDVVDNAGLATTADVAWSGYTTYYVDNGTSADPRDDAQMMAGYLDKGWGDQPCEITVSNIPYALYNVYVYVGSSNDGATAHVIRDNGAEQYSFTNDCKHTDFAPTDYSLTTDTGDLFPLANYAVFSNLTGSSVFINLDYVESQPGNSSCDQVAGIFGVQIVEVPEPMTLTLLGLGGLGLIKRSRRA